MSEQDSDFFRTMTLVLVGLGVFFVIIIVAANIVSSESSDGEPDQRVQDKINELIKPVGMVNTEAGAAPAPAAGSGAIDAQQAYQQACFACHGTGAAGAPKLDDKAGWKSRLAQGNDVLYDHAINGFNAMPPRGGSSLDDDAMKAVVDYMVNQVK